MDHFKNKNQREEEEKRRGEKEVAREEKDVSISDMSFSGEESDPVEETPGRQLRSQTQKAESASKLKLASGPTKKRALKSSDEEAYLAVPKMSTATRGRKRGTAAGMHSFLKAAKEHLAEGLESDVDDSDPTYRASLRKPVSPRKVGPLRDSEHSAEEERRRLCADNARLARELELVRAELRAFKEAYSESQKRTAANAAPTEAPQAHSNLEEVLKSALEGMRRELLQSVGGLVNARLESLESRLPPEPVLRPPLRADKRQPPPPRPETRSGLAPGAIGGDPGATQAPKAKPRLARRRPTKPTGPPPPPSSSQDVRGSAGRAGQEDHTPQTAGSEVQWSKVVGRKAKGKGKTPASAGAPSQTGTSRKGAVGPPPTKAVKIVAPKTAAISLTLKKGATISTAEGQVTEARYVEVLAKAKASIRLSDFGLETIRIRTSMTGSKLMEVGGETPEETADRLASELTKVIGAMADIARPSKLVDLRISGLDETVTQEEVATKVATVGGCSPSAVKVGLIRPSFWGGGSALVKCPATAAKAAVTIGKVAIGWSMATINAVKARPLRCYKCMLLGHTRALCPTEVENGQLCFRCGEAGHKAAACEAPCKCAVCAKAGRPHVHVMGGDKCVPPTVKGRASAGRPRPSPPQNCQPAEETMQVS
ncbi:PREDICTED: uncharacterized protein LOC106113582 [Papilio xuthus]|uniref:Uncharacterized protein LOC106113582 n=1 Tax=Papilio xuthus TaxID=66420 RepID=A0AAJ6YZ22_PAPXU|nr:PREDICTED: uncharacterized protein LOC106113582 [Papilio xuthus]